MALILVGVQQKLSALLLATDMEFMAEQIFIGVLISAETNYGRIIETSFFIAFSCDNYYNDLLNIDFGWNNQKITGL
jgi:hypothetical protein